jgi:hypothetical protein
VTLEPHTLRTVVELATVTFLIGILIGFIGAGGAGNMVANLTTVLACRFTLLVVPFVAEAMFLFW